MPPSLGLELGSPTTRLHVTARKTMRTLTAVKPTSFYTITVNVGEMWFQ